MREAIVRIDPRVPHLISEGVRIRRRRRPEPARPAPRTPGCESPALRNLSCGPVAQCSRAAGFYPVGCGRKSRRGHPCHHRPAWRKSSVPGPHPGGPGALPGAGRLRRSSAARTPGFDPGGGGANPPAARILIPPLAHQQSARPIIARRPGRHRRGGPPCRWMAEKSCTGLKHRPVWSVTRSSGVPRFEGPWQTSGMRPPCKRDHVGANPTGSTIVMSP